jgi:hypothetical protein
MSSTRLSPQWGWAFAGAVSFPALTLALGYLPTTTLVAVATGIAGLGLVAGAILAAIGRGTAPRQSAQAWAAAYAVGLLVYVTGLYRSWPQPDNAVIVTPDGRGGLNDGQEILLLLLSLGVTLLLGAVLDELSRAALGRRLRTAAVAAMAWTVASLSLPILIVAGIYATSILGNTIPVFGEAPGHFFGLICSGALAGFVAGTIGEELVRRSVLD